MSTARYYGRVRSRTSADGARDYFAAIYDRTLPRLTRESTHVFVTFTRPRRAERVAERDLARALARLNGTADAPAVP